MIEIVKIALYVLLIGMAGSARAGYNDNMAGVVSYLFTYPDGVILFKLNNQPTSHPVCNPAYFAISTDVADVAANRMFSRLLAAYKTGETINIGFDNAGGCANSYIRVHRVG